MRHNYSKNQPWNADGSLIKTDGSYAKILDGSTYEVLRIANPKSLWSNIDPKVTFETAQNKFYKNNIDTNEETVLRIFSEYEKISIGYGEGNLSNDDRWIALIGTNGKNQTILVYDILNDYTVGSKYIGSAPMDWASVSQSGEFVVIRYYTNGSGNHQGVKSYNRKMQNEVHLLDFGAHADIGYDMTGNEVYVSVGRYQGHSLSYTRLDNGFTKGLWRSAWKPGDRGIAGAHVSTRNLKRPGWAYISTDQQAHDPLVYAAPKEIFAIRLDDSETIERFGQHHTKFDGSKSPYNHEVHPVPNRDGTKVIFASNWHNSQWMNNDYPMMWVVEADQDIIKLSVNAGEDVSICQGTTTTLTATGGSTYLWNTGAKTASITVSPDKTTTYTVTAYDSTGNNSDSDGVTVTVNSLPEVNAGSDVTIKIGDKTTLTATGAASYLWSTGETTASIEVSPTTTTIYTVIGTTNSCEAEDSVTVFSVDASVKANAGEDTDICLGDTTTLTATGGTHYVWSTGETTKSIVVSPETTTTYKVTVSDDNDESDDASVTVTVNAIPVASAGEDQTICFGQTTTLTATGGTSYLWSTGATTASIEVNPTAETTYSVEVSNNGCFNTDDVSVFVENVPVLTITGDIIISEGESTTLTVIGGDNYEWSTSETTESITVSPKVTTTYSVSSRGSNGCSGNASITVAVAQEVFANAGQDMDVCTGASVTLTATGGSTYLWSTGAKTASISVTPNATTTYTVTAYDSTGTNSDTDEVKVTVNPLQTVDAGNNITINSGQSTTLTATGATTYKWSTGTTGATVTVSPTASQTYTVTGTTNGCEASDTVRVTVINPEGLTADAGADQTICAGASVTLTATGGSSYLWSTGAKTESISVTPNTTTTYTVTAYDSTGTNSDTDEVKVTVNPLPTVDAGNNITIYSGESTTLTATGASTYKWSTGATGASITVNPTATKTYTVTGIKNGCEATSTVKVTVKEPEAVVARAGGNQDVCEGGEVTLTATGGERYLWSTGATTASIKVNPKTTTKYSVTAYVGDFSGTDEAIVTVSPQPKVVIINGSEADILEGEFITLSARGANSYKWSNGATQPNIAVRPTKTKTYDVVGHVNDCSSEQSIKVNVYEKVVANAGDDVAICLDETTVLTAKGPANSEFLWSTGETTKSITVSPDEDTEYSVMVYHDLDSDTDSVMVNVRNCVNSQVIGDSVTIEDTEAIDFLIHPNPTDGEVHIKISGLSNASSIHLYDLSGKSLYNEAISINDHQSYNKTLDLSEFASGIYLLQLVDNQKVITKKIVLR
ncbi:T9SS type A sorting domain-containing protein [Gelidibacter gilvus]|uniref:T9SS type A sorting domain-containing protein n=1 Tax=Gelidibacter gilvus TaxID=59602 RepID=UPI00167E1CB6|nr:T9SS type A sorting domain-containing protein [Gelidibacter gilvus]